MKKHRLASKCKYLATASIYAEPIKAFSNAEKRVSTLRKIISPYLYFSGPNFKEIGYKNALYLQAIFF